MKSIFKDIKSAYIGVVATLCVLFSVSESYAQQDSQYTQYMYNTSSFNPAYAGNRDVFSAIALYRAQWVGLDGAPKTINFTAHSPVGERVGLGLSFTNDEIGPSVENSIAADFSYTIPLGDDLDLSFGLKGGVNLLDVDFTKLLIYDPTDPQFEYNIDNRLTPIIGAGIFLNNDKWYAGLSVPNFLQTEHYDQSSISTAKEKMNFYAIGGYVFDIGSGTKLKPAVLLKSVEGSPIALDLSANFLFNDKFTLGGAYRLSADFSALAGFQYNESIMIGYSYDYGVQDLANYNNGSHEIFLRFELFSSITTRMVTPRFF
ncbi:hypothetical protein SCB49_01117 [unidentified eubacterium SCB49]|nr:hypothetical protein SCB49_01117 [unidentified eubacterium SCB49]